MAAWKVMRAPVLWCIGIAYEGYLVWELLHHGRREGDDYFSIMSDNNNHERPTMNHLVPLLLGGSLMTAIVFSLGCGVLFLYDVYYTFIIESEAVRSIVQTALQYSLDDILSVVCDPTQLALHMTAFWLIPTTIYTLPTAPHERSRVLKSAGFIPTTGDKNDGDEILLQPGAWKSLLPQALQKILSEILKTTSEEIIVSATPKMVEVSMERMSEDGDQHDGEREPPYSISPIYASAQPDPQVFEVADTQQSTPVGPETTDQMAPSSVEVELFQVLTCAVQKILKEKLVGVYEELQKLPLLTLAVSSLGILIVHQKQSATARSLLHKVFQLCIMAGTSSTAIVSILGLVIPMVHDLGISQKSAQKQSFLQNLCGLASCMGLVKTAIPSSLSDIVTKRIPWRGTIVALVLFYFRRRFVTSRTKNRNSPKGFS